jgi:diguanylate cyclase (GGDEF)-like protein
MDAKNYVAIFLNCCNLACAIYVMNFAIQYRKKGLSLFIPFFRFASMVFVFSLVYFVTLYPPLIFWRMFAYSLLAALVFFSYALFMCFMVYLFRFPRLKRRIVTLFFIALPVVGGFMALTNPWTHFFFDPQALKENPYFLFARTPRLAIFSWSLAAILGLLMIGAARSPVIRFKKSLALDILLTGTMIFPIIIDCLARWLPFLAGTGIAYLCVTLTPLLMIRVYWRYLPVSRSVAAEMSNVIYLVFDTFGCCTDWNRRGSEFFNAYTALQDQGKPTLEGLLKVTGFSLDTLMIGKEQEFFLVKDNETRHYRLRRFQVSRIHPLGTNGIGITIQDITQFKLQESWLSEMANWDTLTRVNNRRFLFTFFEHLQTCGQDRVVSALMVDIDFFKQINDTHGHLAGDEVLKEIAIRCKKCLRSGDIICRYGGEEFLILLTDTKSGELSAIAERIRQAVGSETIPADNKSIQVTVSIGGYSFALGTGMSPDSVIERADQAMYQAKLNGRNQVYIPLP